MDLKEWTVIYVKNKDLLHKKLVEYEETDKVVHFKFKDKTHDYFILENLEIVESKADFTTLVCLASKNNLKFLISNWPKLNHPNLNLIFVNLDKNNKWIISPNIHSKIADPESLELGLRTMYDQVA